MQVQSEQVRLKKGDIYLVNPNVIHAIKGVENEENLCMFVQMRRELLAFDEEDNKEVRFYLDSTDEEEPEKGFAYFYKKMAELVYESMREDRHQVFRIRAQVCTMIADLFDQVIYDIHTTYYRLISRQKYTKSASSPYCPSVHRLLFIITN